MLQLHMVTDGQVWLLLNSTLNFGLLQITDHTGHFSAKGLIIRFVIPVVFTINNTK